MTLSGGSESGRWIRIESLFHQVLERPLEERAGFLESACAGDMELRQAVEALLEADSAADDLFLSPAATVREAWIREDQGRYIGPYRVIRPIGAGGMGEVYLGLEEGADFKRYAAVKVARRGLGADGRERFSRERSILAELEHPGIARFLGAGSTDEDWPYVAMEYVEGERIDRYADRNRLRVVERVELFRQVCLAVQYAHANLIVHRDLKPANILVTADGTPKLLDFGIAKLLGKGSASTTRTSLRLATPAYAAPEQLRGGSVGTPADVYALGAVLYELLVGHRPFSAAATAARIEGTTTSLPTPPSARVTGEAIDGADTAETVGANRGVAPATLRRVLRSDLDNIVLKAMDPEPTGRYLTAAALADDLERYLRGEPVRARPPSLAYRAGKFVRRNRVAVGAVAALFLTLVGSTVATLAQNQRIQEQAARIESDRDRAREVQGFLLESFGSSGQDDLAGDTLTVRGMLDARARRVDALYDDEPEIRAEMHHVLADGYERLGALDEARARADQAVVERRLLGGPASRDLARSLGLLGWIQHQQGQVEAAKVTLQESVDLARSVPVDSAGLARSLNDLCGVLTTLGQPADAEIHCREAMEIRRAIYPDDHRALAVTANNLGNAVGLQGRREESLELAQESARILGLALGPRHRRTLMARRNVAVGYAWLGDWERSADEAREVAEAYEALGGPFDIDLAWSLESLGSALGRLGRFSEADSVLSRAHGIASGRLGDHPLTAYLLDQRRGLLQRAGESAAALDLAREAVRTYESIYSNDHPDWARALQRRGELTDDPDEAVRSFRAAAEMSARLQGAEGRAAVAAELGLARAMIAAGHQADALPLYERLRETVPAAYGANHQLAVAPYLGQAHAQALMGQRESALASLRDAVTRLVGAADTPSNREWLAEVRALLDR